MLTIRGGRLAPFPAAVASCGVSLPALPPPVEPLPGAPVGPPGPPAPGSRGKESCFLFFSGLSVKKDVKLNLDTPQKSVPNNRQCYPYSDI